MSLSIPLKKSIMWDDGTEKELVVRSANLPQRLLFWQHLLTPFQSDSMFRLERLPARIVLHVQVSVYHEYMYVQNMLSVQASFHDRACYRKKMRKASMTSAAGTIAKAGKQQTAVRKLSLDS